MLIKFFSLKKSNIQQQTHKNSDNNKKQVTGDYREWRNSKCTKHIALLYIKANSVPIKLLPLRDN